MSDFDGKKILAFAGILLIAILGLVFFINYSSSHSQEVRYNGHTFEKKDGLWLTKVAGNTLMFRFNPYEVEGVSVQGPLELRQPVYLVSTAGKSSSRDEVMSSVFLENNIHNGLGVEVRHACTSTGGPNEIACKGRQVVTCSDVGTQLTFHNTGEAKVLLEGNCIKIYGSDIEMQKAVDRLTFALLGIQK